MDQRWWMIDQYGAVINIYRSEMMILNASMCSLKLECEKLAQEKTEIQRQYIMVSASPPHQPLNLINSNS